MEPICDRESLLVRIHPCLPLSKVLKADGASKVDRRPQRKLFQGKPC